jgi:primary-amine oxidase
VQHEVAEMGALPADLVFMNPGQRTRLGNEVGCRLSPSGTMAASVQADDDILQRRMRYSTTKV